MTRLPTESRDVWGVPGPKYLPEFVCAHPFCNVSAEQGAPSGLERHHLYPRSFLRHQPTEWVKLPDGRVTQNCVYLCREHHQQITENKAKIEWGHRACENCRSSSLTSACSCSSQPEGFLWRDEHSWKTEPLNPQPRFRDSDERDESPSDSETLGGEPEPSRGMWWHNSLPVPHEGEECGLCKRRVPRKRKATTPTSTTFSFRLPLDEKDELKEIIEAAAKHLGIYEGSYPHYRTVLQSLVLSLQGPGADER